jgi:uncharacterized membrane protein
MADEKKRRIPAEAAAAGAVLLLILAVAFVVRVWRIGEQSVWCDEMVSISTINSGSLMGFLKAERALDPPMVPLYFVLAYGWAHTVGTDPVSVRLLSVLFGILTVGMLYVTGRAMQNRTAGLAAAMCGALSLTQIYYSQEIRMYSLVVLLVLVSTYTLYRALETGRNRWWVINVITNMLLLWTHLFSIFLLAAQGLMLLIELRRLGWKRVVAWGGVQAPNLMLFAFWVSKIDQRQLSVAAGWRYIVPHGPLILLNDFLMLAGARFIPSCACYVPFKIDHLLYPKSLGLPLPSVMGLALFAAAGGATYAAFRAGWFERRKVLVALTLLAVPPVVMHVISAAAFPCYQVRYIVYASMGWFLIIGIAVGMIKNNKLRLGAFAGLALLYLVNYAAASPQNWRNNWLAASETIKAAGRADSKIMVVPQFQENSLMNNGGFAKRRFIAAPEDHPARYAATIEEAKIHGEAWLVAVYSIRIKPEVVEPLLKENGIKFERTLFGDEYTAVAVYRLIHDPAWKG